MYMFLSTDPFSQTANKKREVGKDLYDLFPTSSSIRRPYRGIQVKEDTYSTISVRRPNGSPVFLTSSSDPTGNRKEGKIGKVQEYADYILQNVQEQRVEKQQIIETFGDPYVYFFGERPRILAVSGMLMNTEDFNWRAQFWENYDKHLRGTKLVQQNARVYLSYDTVIIEGYILEASAVDNSGTPYSIPFNFSMLQTNYYDWSNIGQTLFPGAKQNKSFEVLNQELEERRTKYVSSGEAVRLKNLQADPGGGVFSAIRGGIRKFNQIVSLAGGVTDRLHSMMTGRNVRVPLGIAGYLASTGAAQIASGSIVPNSPSLIKQYDAATGNFKDIRGSVKLRMPGNALFAPPWVSQITGEPRGYIFENVDEYPRMNQPSHILQLLTPSAYIDYLHRRLARQETVEKTEAALLEHNMMAESGGILGTISDAVNFTRSAYSMVMTAKAFIDDPSSIIKASLGVGIGTKSNSRLSKSEWEKLGIKTRVQQERAERTQRYIGEEAIESFKSKADAKIADPEEASLGEVYQTSAYVSQQGDPASYEEVYGSNDYTPLIEQVQAVDAEAALTGEQPGFSEQNVQATLDEVYGNVDTPPGSDVEPESLDAVYGTGSSSTWVRTPEEIAAALAQTQSTDVEADEDTSGIIGVDDEEARIDPII